MFTSYIYCKAAETIHIGSRSHCGIIRTLIVLIMKSFSLVLCLAVAVLAQEKYENINDDFDISEVLSNERLLNSYAKCLLDKGPCTPEVKSVKEKLPEALETRCAKCTDKQRQMGKKLAQEVKKTRPELWKQLISKYDPQGKYQESFEDFLKN